MEIESRLLPCGLHTIGKPPTAEEAVATLVNIAALERDEDGLRSLPALLAESIGRSIEDIYKGNDEGVLADVELNREITETCRAAVGSMVRSLTGLDGRVSMRNAFGWFYDLLTRFGLKLPSPWLRACCNAGFTQVDSTELDKLFGYLRFCLEQVCADMEMESLLRLSTVNTFCLALAVTRSATREFCPVARTSIPSIPGDSNPAAVAAKTWSTN